MFAVYIIFFFEVAANRISMKRLEKAGLLSGKYWGLGYFTVTNIK